MRPTLMDLMNSPGQVVAGSLDLNDTLGFYRANLYPLVGELRGESFLKTLSARTALILYVYLMRNAPEA